MFSGLSGFILFMIHEGLLPQVALVMRYMECVDGIRAGLLLLLLLNYTLVLAHRIKQYCPKLAVARPLHLKLH